MLSVKTKQRLTNALTRKSLADEMEAAIFAHAPLSDKLKRAIVVALASKSAGLSMIAAIETAGAQAMSLDAEHRSVQMMARKDAGLELIAAIEAAN